MSECNLSAQIPRLSALQGVNTHTEGHMSDCLKAPFPYFGGKSKVADKIWARFGNVDNYVEPFAGTIAVLLRRPTEHFIGHKYRTETVNDANHFLVNFWRAVAADPEQVAHYADWPVTEADLHARHQWLMRSRGADDWRQAMKADPGCYDAKIAGWWVWGQSCWIGSGWCAEGNNSKKIPKISSTDGVIAAGRPQLADAFDLGRGVNSTRGLDKKRPVFPDSKGGSRGVVRLRRDRLVEWMRQLSDRLRNVRVCYGPWSRICDSESTLTRLGTTGVFLDPPYPKKRADSGEESRSGGLYANDETQCLDALRDEVVAWCRKWSGPEVKIAVCGYEGDGYEVLEAEGWDVESWEASGGYANQGKKGKGKENAARERIWYSPACVVKAERTLFDLTCE